MSESKDSSKEDHKNTFILCFNVGNDNEGQLPVRHSIV